MDHHSEKDINFSAITEGLGFHPFSDGLPYAPVGKKQEGRFANGSGAVSAGPALPIPTYGARERERLSTRQFNDEPAMGNIFNPPPRPAAMNRVSVPVATPANQTVRQTVPAPATAPSTIPEPSYGFIYLSKRVLAFTLDTTLNLSICITGLSMILIREDLAPASLASSEIIAMTCFFLIFFNWILITAQEFAFGTTVGKRIFGLALQGSAAAIALRAFFFLPSIGFLGTGLVWALFDRRKRCWHDIIVDLQPDEIARL